jgi:signal transduction histidine kinase
LLLMSEVEIRDRTDRIRVLAGGGQMGELMRAIDWSQTAVGPVESWPQSLRTAISILLESRFAMMIAWGPQLTHFYNDAYRPILGSSKHPSLGRPVPRVFPEIWSTIGPLFEEVMKGNAVGFDDLPVPLDRNGYLEECTFTFSYSPIRDESGAVGGVLVTVAETTNRVLGERRLRTLTELAGRAAEPQSEAQAWQEAAQALAANPADIPFALLYDLDREGKVGTLAATVGPVGPDIAASPLAIGPGLDQGWPLHAALAAGRPRLIDDVEARFPPQVGSTWPEPVRSAVLLPVLRPGAASAYGVMVLGLNPRRALDDAYRDFCNLVADHVATGVANARAREEERRRAESLAELDRVKTTFFSNISHELRTPLTLMLGPQEDALAAGVELGGEDLRTVHRNTMRLLKLVNSLLDFSRIEAGRMQARYQPQDLSLLTRDLASAFRSAIERSGLRFEVDCPPLPRPVHVDREMWEKIVLNLLSNAFKFTFEGTISLSLRARGGAVQLAVKDSGVGIPEAQLPRLFERFHRIEGARSRTHEGSGIGLSLVKDLVELHGGSIQVDSQPGQGSIFTVTVPLGTAHLPADRVASAAPPSGRSEGVQAFLDQASRWLPSAGEPPATNGAPAGEGASNIPSGARVLVADDNADMRGYLTRLLQRYCTVEAVADGVQALARAQEDPPDMILADVMMPNLDGFGLLRALRADRRTAGVPVIMLSARAGDESRVEGLTAGADDYLVKPFSGRELVARVATHVQLTRLRREVERRARAEAEMANRAKDEFLAMLGHELRNPLSPILTALHLMRMRGQASEEQAVIERQVANLIRLVDDLLDVSRITRGKIELRKRRVELAEVVVRGLETADPLLSQRRQRVVCAVPPEGLPVDGDPDRLAQVVSNLLTNASKYSEPGTTVQITAERSGALVQLRVRDQGVGIEPQMLDRVFDLFVQEPQSLDRSKGGLGLGLAIVRSLVELHGGSVSAASEGVGRGSEFCVRLPLAAGSDRMEATASSRPLPMASGPGDEPEDNRILVVDDNVDGAEGLAEILRDLGNRVEVAHDGPTALELAKSLRPNVCLLDIGLPVMDGYQLARHLRASNDLPPDALIIAISGYGQDADRRRSQEAGFNAHLVKPVNLDALRRTIVSGSPIN